MRFQKFLNRERAFRAFAENLNLGLSGYTNTASAFLPKSLSDLNGAPVPRPRLLDELSPGDAAEAVACAEKRDRMPDWVDEFFRKLKIAARERADGGAFPVS